MLRCRFATIGLVTQLIVTCLACSVYAAPFQRAVMPMPPAVHTDRKLMHLPTKSANSSNVRRGTIESIDPAIAKLMLKTASAKLSEFELTDKTRYWRNRHSVESAAFKAGDAVVAHLRHNRKKADAMLVVELDDKVSWDWLTAMRHRTTRVTIKSVDDDSLSVAVGTEALPFTYVLSQNTLLSRGGKTIQPSEFRSGDTVYVVPRALPGGDVQARAVADSMAAATLLKERASTSVRGTIHTLDSALHTLMLTTPGHEVRSLICDTDLEVTRGGKSLPWEGLKVGQNVTARLHRNDVGVPAVWHITILKGRPKSIHPFRSAVRKKASIRRHVNSI